MSLQALTWTSGATSDVLDLRSIAGGFWLSVVEGLDGLPDVRREDDFVPFLPGRLRTAAVADSRRVILEGSLLPLTDAGYPALVDALKTAFDPLASITGTLAATLEDGTVATIDAAPVSLLMGEPLRAVPTVSIELDAEPYWMTTP